MSTDPAPSAAIVTGASRGFGRAISAGLVAAGWHVVGVARGARDLDTVRAELGPQFTPVPGDATDEQLATVLLTTHRPRLLVLNAGATPETAPLPEQSWDTFTHTWNVDTRHAFGWVRAALRTPLAPDSVVVTMSSGAALRGSPLSGGWAGAKAMVGFLTSYAAAESERMGLGLRFLTLYPTMSATGIGMVGVRAYAARQGIGEHELIATLEPVLTPELVAKAVLDLAAADTAAPAYVLTGSGPAPLEP